MTRLEAVRIALGRFAASGRTPAQACVEAAAALELALAEGRVEVDRARRALGSLYDGRAEARVSTRGDVHMHTHVLGRAMVGIIPIAPRAGGGRACGEGSSKVPSSSTQSALARTRPFAPCSRTSWGTP